MKIETEHKCTLTEAEVQRAIFLLLKEREDTPPPGPGDLKLKFLSERRVQVVFSTTSETETAPEKTPASGGAGGAGGGARV